MSNEFYCAKSYWRNTAHALLRAKPRMSRLGQMREIIGYKYCILNPRRCWAGDMRRPEASIGYAYAELLWYLSLSRSIEMIKAYSPSYARFAERDGNAFGAYGYRWENNPGISCRGRNSLQCAMDLLASNPNERRAVIAMWDSGDIYHSVMGIVKDIPCTLTIQFLCTDNKLHMIVNMRSNDLFLGGIYDPFCFCSLQLLCAAYLGMGVGEYHHTVGSMHLYEKDVQKVQQSLDWDSIHGSAAECTMPTRDEAVTLIDAFKLSDLATCENNMRTAILSGQTYEVSQYAEMSLCDHQWSHTAMFNMHQFLKGKHEHHN